MEIFPCHSTRPLLFDCCWVGFCKKENWFKPSLLINITVVSSLGFCLFIVPDWAAANDLRIAYQTFTVYFSSKIWYSQPAHAAQLHPDRPCQIALLSGWLPLTSLFIFKNGCRGRRSKEVSGNDRNIFPDYGGGYMSVYVCQHSTNCTLKMGTSYCL